MTEESIKNEDSFSSGKTKKKYLKKGKGVATNFVLVVIIIMTIGLFVWAEQNRRDTARRLEETSAQLKEMQDASQASGEDVANEVLEKVVLLIDIPMDPKPTVATINDIDRLKEANPFFEAAKNGDYLILTGNRAVLYDSERNIVLDVAPFVINGESPSPMDDVKTRENTQLQDDVDATEEMTAGDTQ